MLNGVADRIESSSLSKLSPMVKFSRNGVPPLCLVFHRLKLPFLHLTLSFHYLDSPHCIFGQFIFGKIITFVATRGWFLKLKCTKFSGVGTQSTLGGTTFLPEKYVWNINKLPEFYMILARKIIKFLWYLPGKLTNFTWFCPKNARILHKNCLEKFFSWMLGGTWPHDPVSYAYANSISYPTALPLTPSWI